MISILRPFATFAAATYSDGFPISSFHISHFQLSYFSQAAILHLFYHSGTNIYQYSEALVSSRSRKFIKSGLTLFSNYDFQVGRECEGILNWACGQSEARIRSLGKC